MSNIWARSPDLFIYTKGNEVYLWRCNKTTWMPMIGQDFDVVAQIIDHQALMGEDSLFDWDKKYYDDMISYISPRRLLVNNRGLVIVELRKFGQDGKLDENDQLPFYVRSFDVMSLKPYNLRDRTIPSRTVRYLGGEGRAAPVEDSNVPSSSSGNITTSDDQKKWDEKREALEKQVKELTDANKTLKNDNIELRDANKTLKSEKEAAEKQASDLNEAAEKQASDLNDRNKTLAEKNKKKKERKKKTLAEDVEAQKTAAGNALQERNDANRDKEAPEKKAVELQTQIDNKKEGWMNDLSDDSGWSRAEYLQPYIHRGVSGDYTTFRVVVVGERGTFTVDDNTTNVRASYVYGVKIIDHDGNVDINLQRATKEYKAVKLEDLNPGKEKARFGSSNWGSSNWVRGMFNGDTYVIKEINFFCLVD